MCTYKFIPFKIYTYDVHNCFELASASCKKIYARMSIVDRGKIKKFCTLKT